MKQAQVDVETGRTDVTFENGNTVAPEELWRALLESGFTPVRIELRDSVYEGPTP